MLAIKSASIMVLAFTVAGLVGCSGEATSSSPAVTPQSPPTFDPHDLSATRVWLRNLRQECERKKDNPLEYDEAWDLLAKTIKKYNGNYVEWEFRIQGIGGGTIYDYYITVGRVNGIVFYPEGALSPLPDTTLTAYVDRDISAEYYRTLREGSAVTVTGKVEFTIHGSTIIIGDAKIRDP